MPRPRAQTTSGASHPLTSTSEAWTGFLHENVDYAARLLSAGVPTELHVLPLAPHGFEHIAPDAAITKTANVLSEAALVRVLSTPCTGVTSDDRSPNTEHRTGEWR